MDDDELLYITYSYGVYMHCTIANWIPLVGHNNLTHSRIVLTYICIIMECSNQLLISFACLCLADYGHLHYTSVYGPLPIVYAPLRIVMVIMSFIYSNNNVVVHLKIVK